MLEFGCSPNSFFLAYHRLSGFLLVRQAAGREGTVCPGRVAKRLGPGAALLPRQRKQLLPLAAANDQLQKNSGVLGKSYAKIVQNQQNSAINGKFAAEMEKRTSRGHPYVQMNYCIEDVNGICVNKSGGQRSRKHFFDAKFERKTALAFMGDFSSW